MVTALLNLLENAHKYSGEDKRIELSAGVRNGGVVVRRVDGHTKVSGGAVIGARDNRVDSSGLTSQSILTMSGKAANIWVGQTVAEPRWTFEYGCGRGWWKPDYVWQELGASLWVRPMAQADGTIDLEVFPRITSRGPAPLSVDVKELSTHVRVADGVPTPIGGLTQSQREVFTRLLGKGELFNGSSLGITLKATVVKPRRPPPGLEDGKAEGKTKRGE